MSVERNFIKPYIGYIILYKTQEILNATVCTFATYITRIGRNTVRGLYRAIIVLQ